MARRRKAAARAGARPALVLASASPRRRELLTQLGRSFEIVAADVDESEPPGLTPQEVAEALAERKALAVAQRLMEGTILGADTLVTDGAAIFGKPRDRAHAIEILSRLSSRPHWVITGVCLVDARSGRRRTASDRTRVTMRAMTRREIEEYVDSGEAMGKAGAYAIQETGDRFVTEVDGSWSNVVGLPMELLTRMLAEFEEAQE
jgi:septum formation protein